MLWRRSFNTFERTSVKFVSLSASSASLNFSATNCFCWSVFCAWNSADLYSLKNWW